MTLPPLVRKALGWLLMFAGAGVLGVGVVDLVLWAQGLGGLLRVSLAGAAAGVLLAPGALWSRGVHLHHGIAWVQATAITAAASALVMGWVGGMAIGGREGWPTWAVHVGAAVALVALVAGSVAYGVSLAKHSARR